MDKDKWLLEQWKMASELHRHVDTLMWQQFNYFVTLTGILASGLGIVLTGKVKSGDRFIFVVAISVFGAVASLIFASVFRRGFLYHCLRIDQAKKAERELQAGIDGKNKSDDELVPHVYGKGLDNKELSRLIDGYQIRCKWLTRLLAQWPTGDVIFGLSIGMVVFWVLIGLFLH